MSRQIGTLSLLTLALLAFLPGCAPPKPPAADADGDPLAAAHEPQTAATARSAVEPTVEPAGTAGEAACAAGEPKTDDATINELNTGTPAETIAAFNARWRAGVTPENNSAVVLVQAFGPLAFPEENRDRFASLLGIALPPEDGDYFVALNTFVKQQQPELTDDEVYAYWDQLAEARLRPWDADEFPILAAWFETNQKPLDQIVRGTKRTRFFSPLVGRKLSNGTATELNMVTREVARALPARAMLRLKTVDADAAWADLMACFRLARHHTQAFTLTQLLIGVAVQGLACDSARSFACHADLTADQQRACQQDLDELDFASLFGRQLEYERSLAQELVAGLSRVAPGDAAYQEFLGLTKLIDPQRPIDWEVAAQSIDRDYDRLATVIAAANFSARLAAIKDLTLEIRKRFPSQAGESLDLFAHFEAVVAIVLAAETPQERGRRAATLTSELLISAYDAALLASGKATDNMQLTRLTFALADYRRVNGTYPVALSDLVPQHRLDLGTSCLTDDEFPYWKTGSGFTIANVGPADRAGSMVAFDRRASQQAADQLRQSGWKIREFDASTPTAPTNDELLLASLLGGIEYLSILDGTNLTDEGLAHLSSLPKLYSLTFWDVTSITEAGLAQLVKAEGLDYLSLHGCRISSAGLRHLSRLPKLTWLQLNDTRITDRDLVPLPSLRKLESLGLGETDITDAGLVHVAELKNLTRLKLAQTSISDKGLATLMRMTQLKSLDLSSTQITDQGLRQLAGLTQLQSLNLAGLTLSAASVEQLQRALPDCTIEQ